MGTFSDLKKLCLYFIYVLTLFQSSRYPNNNAMEYLSEPSDTENPRLLSCASFWPRLGINPKYKH